MFIVGMLSWWYGAGWKARTLIVRERIEGTMDFFSIDVLLRTLFSPYRQISAGKVDGSIGVLWRAFVDRTISRLIGFILRIVIVVVGSFAVVLQALIGALLLVLWVFIPLLPVIGFVLFISGWTPIVWK